MDSLVFLSNLEGWANTDAQNIIKMVLPLNKADKGRFLDEKTVKPKY